MLLCEQVVVADDTPAINAVLKADTKRLELLEEEWPSQRLAMILSQIDSSRYNDPTQQYSVGCNYGAYSFTFKVQIPFLHPFPPLCEM